MLDDLLQKLKGEDEEEKIKALKELKEYSGEKVLDGLLGALNDTNDYVRDLVIEALGSFEDPRATQALIRLTEDADPLIRMEALEQLAESKLKDMPELLNAFSKCLSDKNALVRATATESIGLLGLKTLNIFLEKNLEDKSPLVRAYSAFALGKVNSISSKELLTQKLQKEKDSKVRLRYYGALYLLGEEKYFKKVVRLLKSRIFEVRSASASLLGHFATNYNKSSILKILNQALSKEDVEIVKDTILETIDYVESISVN